MAENLLYVIFHGLIPLIEFNDHFLAVVIEMADHSKLLGHWLTEDPLQKQDLNLIGVNDGGASLDDSKNLILKMKQIDMDQVNKIRWSLITLPKPRKTYSFLTGSINGQLQGNDSAGMNTFSAVQLFEYVCTGNVEDVKLMAGNTPVFSPIGMTLKNGTSFSVVHIVNEPPVDPTDDHVMQEFNRGVSMYKATDLKEVQPLASVDQNPVPTPPGVLFQELTCLSRRRLAIFEALAEARSADLQLVFHAIAGSHFCGTTNARL